METISAISTARGKGGIAVIRISGDEAIGVASRIFVPIGKTPIDQVRSHSCVYGTVVDNGTRIDDAVLTVFRAPRSYTGEDTVEISCHGGVLVTSRVLEATLSNGARLAGAGEFTKRAFLNGRMTLTEAEAVGGIIDARTDAHLKVSIDQLRGSLSSRIRETIDSLTELVASVYAFIDYPDEDLTELSTDELKTELLKIKKHLTELTGSYRYGKAITEGVPTAIIGKPNAGKSSLLNRLCGFERAIVTEIEGTTRDVITEEVVVGDVLLLLADTAGIRDSDDTIERLGIERSREEMNRSELILAVFDGTKPFSREDEEIVELLRDVCDRTIAVVNKSDETAFDHTALLKMFPKTVVVSAKNGDGIDELVDSICDYLGKADAAGGDVITNARQNSALRNALTHVESALDTLDGFTQDVAAMDIEKAIECLGELDGRTVSEAVVSRIFSKFCVGK